MSDSSTGGYLLNQGVPLPLNDVALRSFLHGVIQGVTDLPNELVRPSWQKNPPPFPTIGTDWVAYGITAQRPDNAPYQEQQEADYSAMLRHEEMDISCIFYGDNCQSFASILRDGLYLSQNREQLFLAGMGLVGFSETTHIPELINDSFFDRCDIVMTLRREIRREYPILNFLSAAGDIYANRVTSVIEEDFDTAII